MKKPLLFLSLALTIAFIALRALPSNAAGIPSTEKQNSLLANETVQTPTPEAPENCVLYPDGAEPIVGSGGGGTGDSPTAHGELTWASATSELVALGATRGVSGLSSSPSVALVIVDDFASTQTFPYYERWEIEEAGQSLLLVGVDIEEFSTAEAADRIQGAIEDLDVEEVVVNMSWLIIPCEKLPETNFVNYLGRICQAQDVDDDGNQTNERRVLNRLVALLDREALSDRLPIDQLCELARGYVPIEAGEDNEALSPAQPFDLQASFVSASASDVTWMVQVDVEFIIDSIHDFLQQELDREIEREEIVLAAAVDCEIIENEGDISDDILEQLPELINEFSGNFNLFCEELATVIEDEDEPIQPEPAERVSFETGSTSAVRDGMVPADFNIKQYMLRAMAGQVMNVAVTSDGAPVYIEVALDRQEETLARAPGNSSVTQLSVELPTTGDYIVTLGAPLAAPNTEFIVEFEIFTPDPIEQFRDELREATNGEITDAQLRQIEAFLLQEAIGEVYESFPPNEDGSLNIEETFGDDPLFNLFAQPPVNEETSVGNQSTITGTIDVDIFVDGQTITRTFGITDLQLADSALLPDLVARDIITLAVASEANVLRQTAPGEPRVTYIAAAGNSGLDFPFIPALMNNVISVSTVDGRRYVSNSGEIAMPGWHPNGIDEGSSFAAPRLSAWTAVQLLNEEITCPVVEGEVGSLCVMSTTQALPFLAYSTEQGHVANSQNGVGVQSLTPWGELMSCPKDMPNLDGYSTCKDIGLETVLRYACGQPISPVSTPTDFGD